MATVKKKPKLTLPPAAPQLDEKAMIAMIEKGGSTISTKKPPTMAEQEDALKSFTIKLYESELAQIRAIQDNMPKRDRISMHDFIVTAVQDKLKRAK